MPLYEYHCYNCEKHFDVIQRMMDPPLTDCPTCGQPNVLEKQISRGTNFELKGTGYYATDFKKK